MALKGFLVLSLDVLAIVQNDITIAAIRLTGSSKFAAFSNIGSIDITHSAER